MDFRSFRMANGGLAACNVFRKHRSEHAIKSKYTSIVRTAEEIAADDAKKDIIMEAESSEEDEVVPPMKSTIRTRATATVDEIQK